MVVNTITYKQCDCGSKDRVCNYNKDTKEGTEFCDVCSDSFCTQIVNVPKYNIFPNGWIPEYRETKIKTGYVLKIWEKGKDGFHLSSVKKESIKLIRAELDKEVRVEKYAITFKDGNGNYQTQIFK